MVGIVYSQNITATIIIIIFISNHSSQEESATVPPIIMVTKISLAQLRNCLITFFIHYCYFYYQTTQGSPS